MRLSCFLHLRAHLPGRDASAVNHGVKHGRCLRSDCRRGRLGAVPKPRGSGGGESHHREAGRQGVCWSEAQAGAREEPQVRGARAPSGGHLRSRRGEGCQGRGGESRRRARRCIDLSYPTNPSRDRRLPSDVAQFSCLEIFPSRRADPVSARCGRSRVVQTPVSAPESSSCSF